MVLAFPLHRSKPVILQLRSCLHRCPKIPVSGFFASTVPQTTIRRQLCSFKNTSQWLHPTFGKSAFLSGPVRRISQRTSREGRLPVTWKSVGGTIALLGVFWAGMMYVKGEKEEALKKERQRQIGKAKIGGEWELTDHNGQARTSKDFHGSWVMIYFGFTHCPDICPDEIEKLLETIKILEKNVPDIKIQPLFITVDPERDSVEAVARYVKEFSPRLLGLTGTREQINKAAKAFRVYYSAAPTDTEDNDYIVDHTIIIYLIDPEGKFVDYYGQNKTAQQMADHIETHVNRFSYLRW